MGALKFTDNTFNEEVQKALLEEQNKFNEEMAALCKKHGVETVYKVAVPLNDYYTEVAVAYLKYPSFEAYSIALTLEDKHPMKGKKIVLDSMWLEGDERLRDISKTENLPMFYSICTIIDEILNIKQALLKKKSMNSLLETRQETN